MSVIKKREAFFEEYIGIFNALIMRGEVFVAPGDGSDADARDVFLKECEVLNGEMSVMDVVKMHEVNEIEIDGSFFRLYMRMRKNDVGIVKNGVPRRVIDIWKQNVPLLNGIRIPDSGGTDIM